MMPATTIPDNGRMRVLIAEDDVETAGLIADSIVRERHDVTVVHDGTAAHAALADQTFDIVILDRMLPGMDGMTVLRAARAAGVRAHVLMLTALGSIANRVEGLEAGADDYLIKPFALNELLARLHAVARRLASDDDPTTLSFGKLWMNILRRELRYDGRFVALQPRELRLLEELMRHRGKLITRAMLLEKVWGFHFEPQTNLVETHMSRLRSKLALAGARDVIRTVRGAGYCLTIEG